MIKIASRCVPVGLVLLLPFAFCFFQPALAQQPTITTQPATVTLGDGSDAAFAVEAAGPGPLSYQWFSSGIALANQTNSTLLRTNVQLPNNGQGYSVRVKNSFGSTNSVTATLNVFATLRILAQQACGGTIHPNQQVTLVLAARAQAPASVTWCQTCVPPPAGLVSSWRGELNASDSTGARPGTLLNGTGFAVGQVGSAFNFDGVDDEVLINAAPLSPPWTVECWINRQQSFNDSAILLGDASTALKLEQWPNLETVGFTQFGVADYAFNYTAPIGEWVHLAFVGNVNNTLLYVNGNGWDIVNASIALPLRQIGGDIPLRFSNQLQGLVDEFSVYNRALSASEIQAVYAAGGGGKCPAVCTTLSASPDSNFASTNFYDWIAPPIPGRSLVTATVSNLYGTISTVFVLDVVPEASAAAGFALNGDFTGCGVSTPLILSAGLPGVFSSSSSSAGVLNTSQNTPCGSYDTDIFAPTPTRWFQVVTHANGLATISTEGTGLDTKIALFLNPIDDPGRLRYIACADDISANNKQSRLTFQALPQSEYWLAVGGLAPSSRLNLSYGYEPRIASLTRKAGGAMQIRSTPIANLPHSIRASSDLRNWSTLVTTNVFPNGMLDFTDNSAASLNRRFYRIIPGP